MHCSPDFWVLERGTEKTRRNNFAARLSEVGWTEVGATPKMTGHEARQNQRLLLGIMSGDLYLYY